jgi:acyl-CoA thioester hydrolase
MGAAGALPYRVGLVGRWAKPKPEARSRCATGGIGWPTRARVRYPAGMVYEFKARRRVEFSDTDMAGIMHFSNFFRFMETVEHGFFRSLGFSIADRERQPRVGWPRVHASCDYHKPLRFEDEVEIHLLVLEKRSKALTYQIRFSRVLAGGTEEVARGRLTVVCVSHAEDGAMRATAIPEEIASKIGVAPEGS